MKNFHWVGIIVGLLCLFLILNIYKVRKVEGETPLAKPFVQGERHARRPLRRRVPSPQLEEETPRNRQAGTDRPAPADQNQRLGTISDAYAQALTKAGFAPQEIEIIIDHVLTHNREDNQLGIHQMDVIQEMRSALGFDEGQVSRLNKAMLEGEAAANRFSFEELKQCFAHRLADKSPCLKTIGDDFIQVIGTLLPSGDFEMSPEISMGLTDFAGKAEDDCKVPPDEAFADYALSLSGCDHR